MVLWTVRNISDYKHTVEKLAQHQLELEHLTHMDHLTKCTTVTQWIRCCRKHWTSPDSIGQQRIIDDRY